MSGKIKVVELHHVPSAENLDVEGAIESGGRGRKSIEHTVIGAGIGSVIGGAGGLGTTAFHGRQSTRFSTARTQGPARAHYVHTPCENSQLSHDLDVIVKSLA